MNDLKRITSNGLLLSQLESSLPQDMRELDMQIIPIHRVNSID